MVRTRSATGLPPRFLRSAADMLKALSHPVRLKLVELLLMREWSVNELAEELRLAQNVVSQHLKGLRNVDVVSRRPEGRTVYYRVTHPCAASLIRCIHRHYFGDASFRDGEAI